MSMLHLITGEDGEGGFLGNINKRRLCGVRKGDWTHVSRMNDKFFHEQEYRKCPACFNHPDIPLYLLGNLP